jgi:hypothetical protein
MDKIKVTIDHPAYPNPIVFEADDIHIEEKRGLTQRITFGCITPEFTPNKQYQLKITATRGCAIGQFKEMQTIFADPKEKFDDINANCTTTFPPDT